MMGSPKKGSPVLQRKAAEIPEAEDKSITGMLQASFFIVFCTE